MTDPKTAAMVEAMLQRNENFRGTSVNEAKNEPLHADPPGIR